MTSSASPASASISPGRVATVVGVVPVAALSPSQWMGRLCRSTLLVAASLAAGLVVNSTAAYAADTTTNLTKDEMTAVVTAVSTASTAGSKTGWRANETLVPGPSTSSTEIFALDPVGGIGLLTVVDVFAEYAVQHKGTYRSEAYDTTARAAVKMIGRPGVRYVFTADKKLTLDHWAKRAHSPANVLDDYSIAAGTKTVHDDGSTDYAYISPNGGTDIFVTLHVDAAGLLATVSDDIPGFLRYTAAYTYGAQKITPPAAAVTVDSVTLAKAEAYLTMADRVKAAATNGAAHTRKAAKGKTVKVASLRAIVRKDAGAVNKSAGVAMVKVVNVAGGVRVSAINPWTHKSVAYTVKASGKKVIVKKA